MRKIKLMIAIAFWGILFSCSKYLDVVPDNIATIENAFTLRTSAEKYLFTCYSYMPDNGHFNDNVAFNAANEVWYMDPIRDVDATFLNIAKGQQNVTSPLGNFWSGSNRGKPLYEGLRDCNIFLDNIDKVKELDVYERERWIAEVKFLKAYYHFILVRNYGPIPLVKANLPISASPDEVKVFREPVDSCFSYIVKLLDESFANELLPDKIVGSEASEQGRITKSIVIAFKAKVLVTAASPLFNGNTEYADFIDSKGRQLINPVYDASKWQAAAEACKAAIDFCSAQGYALSKFTGNTSYTLNDTIQKQLDIRTAVTNKLNNPEVIWANTNSRVTDMQRWCMPVLALAWVSTSGGKGIIAPTLKTVELFYSKNGVPITEDKTWDYANKYALKTATVVDKYYIKNGEQTVQLHFDREPRFYADLGFDRGIWFGNAVGNYDVKKTLLYVAGRKGEWSARQGLSNFSISGYNIKKLVNVETAIATDGNITSNYVVYPWPEFRIADLYLLYSEALNELNGPSPDAFSWINQVRARAGIPTVEYSWTNFSNDPSKFTSKEGLREIIQRERSIELAFEGQLFWDIRRWKTAHEVLNSPVKGWDITQLSPQSYYKEVMFFNQTFTMREYLWPIETKEMQINSNLVQSPGW